MQQPQWQEPHNDPPGQFQQPLVNPQPVQPPVPPSSGFPPVQQQGYQAQPGYQQPVFTPPGYSPSPSGASWMPQPGPSQPIYPQQQMYQQMAPTAVQMTSVNVNVNAQQGANGCLRAVYFVFIGWWLGFWCLEIGFLLCALIITLPLGLMILNRLPQIMTLKPSTQMVQTNVNVTSAMGAGGMANAVNVNVNVTGVQQRPFFVRALYYIFVGCWAGYLWASIAYLLCLTFFGLPLGILMLNQLPVVLTLRRN